jgi:hypothetical protein
LKSNLKTTYLILVLIVIIVKANGQVDSTIIRPSDFRVAYNSSIIYPGAALGIDYPIQEIQLTKSWNDGHSKTIIKKRYISGILGFYHHKGFHDNIYIIPEWVMRRSRGGPWFTEFNAGLGYSRTFLGGTTYKVDEMGNVTIIPAVGFSYAIAAIGYGVGYNYSVKKRIPVSVYTRLSMLLMFPYNSTIYPRPTIEIGLIYIPVHFLERKIKTFHKEK